MCSFVVDVMLKPFLNLKLFLHWHYISLAVGTPRPARGDGGMWRVGRGREPWERSEAGGVIGNERHLHRSPVSSPTEELRKG